jgi:hypothetical protein
VGFVLFQDVIMTWIFFVVNISCHRYLVSSYMLELPQLKHSEYSRPSAGKHTLLAHTGLNFKKPAHYKSCSK